MTIFQEACHPIDITVLLEPELPGLRVAPSVGVPSYLIPHGLARIPEISEFVCDVSGVAIRHFNLGIGTKHPCEADAASPGIPKSLNQTEKVRNTATEALPPHFALLRSPRCSEYSPIRIDIHDHHNWQDWHATAMHGGGLLL